MCLSTMIQLLFSRRGQCNRLKYKILLSVTLPLLVCVQTTQAFNLPPENSFHGEITVNESIALFNDIRTSVTSTDSPFGTVQSTVRIADNSVLTHTLTLLKLTSPANTYIATHRLYFKQNAELNRFKGFGLALPRGKKTRLAYGPADNTSYQDEDYLNIPAVTGYDKAGQMLYGGVPFNDVWNVDGGLYVSVLAEKPDIFELPIKVSKTQIDLAHIYSPDEDFGSKVEFQAGDTLTLPPIMVGLHQGDYFAPLREYVKALEIHSGKDYLNKPLGNTNASAPYWKTWGLNSPDDDDPSGDFTLNEILGITNLLEQRGISRILLDYGWFITEGVWEENDDRGFTDDNDLPTFVEELKGRGFEVGLWYQPLQVDADDSTVQENLLQYAIRDEDNDIYLDDDDVALLDPSKPEVLSLVSNQLAVFQSMGIDHVYVDSQQAQLAAPPNFANTRPLDSHEGLPALYDLIRSEGESRNMTIEICPDGRSQTLLNMPQAVTNIGDPKNDRQLRAEHRWLKAIQGSRAIVGTYVEPFSDNPVSGSFLNIIGIGGNIQSIGDANNLQNEEWNTWLTFQNQHQLVTADYLPLYDIGFDYPEGHVLRRDDYTFYAFFAKTEGSDICKLADCIDAAVTSVESAENRNVDEIVELRGLEANTEYHVKSFPTPTINQLVSTNSEGNGSIHLTFTKEILLVVTPNEKIFNLPNKEWRQISLPRKPPANANTVEAIFGDDISGLYGTDWVVFFFDPEAGYFINPGLNGLLKQGVGYWIYQQSGRDVLLDLPN